MLRMIMLVALVACCSGLASAATPEFEKYEARLNGRDRICFVGSGNHGRFAERFILDELNHYYGKRALIVPMGAWTNRAWFRAAAIARNPAYLIADGKGNEIARLMGVTDVDAVAAFFAKHLGGPPTLFKAWPGGAFNTLGGHLALYRISTAVDGWKKLGPNDQKALLALTAVLKKLRPSYNSVAWLSDTLQAEATILQTTERFRLQRKIVRAVKIVPDVDTFYSELARWNGEMIYPILLGDTRWTMKFLRAYRPEIVVHVPAVKGPPKREVALLRAIASSYQKTPLPPEKVVGADDINQLCLKASKGKPTGLVIIDPDFAAAPAGAALAAARSQMVYVRKGYGDFEKRLTLAEADTIRKDIAARLMRSGVGFRAYGTDLDGLTLACDAPYRYDALDAPEAGVRALDDFIARKDSGAPWGVVGRMLGDEAAAIYRAMCSIFLQPEEALFFSRYSTNSLPWRLYDPVKSVKLFRKVMPVRETHSSESTIKRWKALMASGNRAGFLFINSSGGGYTWSLSGSQGYPSDIPDSVPSQIHIIHSGSSSVPLDKGSVMGTWLEAGAYNYFGSMAEPMLEAFVTPDSVAGRMFRGYPFAVGCRTLTGSYSYPWRLVFFGDPLAVLFHKAESIAPKQAKAFAAPADTALGNGLFKRAYRDDWDGILRATQGNAVGAGSDAYNLVLLGLAKKGRADELVRALNTPNQHALWPENKLHCERILRDKASKARPASDEHRKLLRAAYRIGGDATILDELATLILNSPADSWTQRLASLIKVRGNRDRRRIVTTFTHLYLAKKPRSLEEIEAFINAHLDLLAKSRNALQKLNDRILNQYATNPTLATSLLGRLTKVANSRTRSTLAMAHASYLMGAKEYAQALTALEQAGKYDKTATAYYTALIHARMTPAKAAQILQPIMAMAKGYRLSALKDEVRLLVGSAPKRKQVAPKLRPSVQIVIDGNLDEAVWKDAPEILRTETKGKSSLRLVLTSDRLYLGGVFRLDPGQKPVVRVTKRDGPVWGDEGIELFFDANRDYKTAHQIVINAAGTTFDTLSFNKSWNGDIIVKTKILPERWILEASLPVKELLSGAIAVGDAFGFNVVRNSPRGKPSRVRWSPCGGSNHAAMRYGYLRVSAP
jgi:hypothetical protein